MSTGQKIIAVLLGILGLIIATQIAFDFSISELNIPVTGQTLGVILVAYFLPSYLGVIAVGLYLLLGGLGLPIFADGAAGWSKFVGGSGGFLIGFFLASIFIYCLKLMKFKKHLMLNVFINIGGTMIIVAAGVAWLTTLYGFYKALEYGFYPFWIGALVKIFLGILIIAMGNKISNKKEKINTSTS